MEVSITTTYYAYYLKGYVVTIVTPYLGLKSPALVSSMSGPALAKLSMTYVRQR
jgi:hypothetical protein